MKKIFIFQIILVLFFYSHHGKSNPIVVSAPLDFDIQQVYDIRKTKELLKIEVKKKNIKVSGFIDYSTSPQVFDKTDFILAFPVIVKKDIAIKDLNKRYKSGIKSSNITINFKKSVLNKKLSKLIKKINHKFVVYDIWFYCQSSRSTFRIHLSYFQNHMTKAKKIYNIYIPLFEDPNNNNRNIDKFQINVTGKNNVSFDITSEHTNMKKNTLGILILPKHNNPIRLSIK